jgi:RNA polymerase sigma-70 factor (ECF subfamily)
MPISERELLAVLPRLRRYARSLTRSGAEAEDLLHDCLQRALEKQHTWRGDNLAGWLASVMTNLYRNRGRRPSEAADADPDGLPAPETPADPLERRRLQAAIDLLGPDQRAVLMLVVVEGYTYAEVAGILGVPVGTVMSRLSRARAAVAEALRSQNVVAFPRQA